MNIVVVLKQTPDTESVIRIAGDSKSVVTDGFKWIINPYDEFAVEAALRVKEKHKGKVTILSYGPPRVVEAVRTALAMGADDAVVIDEPSLESCGRIKVAQAVAAAIKQLNPDLVFTGSRAVDYDMAQRGPMVAEFLGWPHLALATALECDGTNVSITRPIEGGKVTMESTLPALVTFGGSHAVWNPRYASLPGIMKAKKKPLQNKKLADLGLDVAEFVPEKAKVRNLGLEMPQERAPGRIIGADLETEAKAAELVRVLHDEAKVI